MSALNGNPLPQGWAYSSIADVVIDRVKQAPPAEGSTVKYIDITSIDRATKRIAEAREIAASDAPTRARQWVRAGDVLVSMTRPNLNAVARVPASLEGAVSSTGFDVLRPNGIASAWLFYRVQSEEFLSDLTDKTQGVVYPAVRPRDVRAHRLPVPPLPEQDRIVAVIETELTRIDAAVAALERVRANLKRYRASVLKAAVEGRLVPTEAELASKEGRDFEPASVLLDRILAERRRRWEESELARMKAAGKPPKDDRWKSKYKEPAAPNTSTLPQLPDGWCWSTVEQISTDCLIGIDRGRQQEVSADIGHPYLRMNNLTSDGRIDLSKLSYVHASKDESLRFEIGAGDILFNTRNSVELVGKTAIVRQVPLGTLYNNNLMRIRVSPQVIGAFVSGQMNSESFKARLNRVKRATTNVAAVYAKDLLPLPVALPPFAEQARISSEISRLHSGGDATEPVIEACMLRCARLRQAILKWAFEGRLVDQDPNDEPASVLLDRIRAERAATTPTAKSRKTNAHEIEAAK